MSTAVFLLNSKSKFHLASLVRVVPVVGLREEQGVEEQGGELQGRGRKTCIGGARGRARGRGRAWNLGS